MLWAGRLPVVVTPSGVFPTKEEIVTLEMARFKATLRAKLLGVRYHVLGPCPIDGYWIADDEDRNDLWPDREIRFTARP